MKIALLIFLLGYSTLAVSANINIPLAKDNWYELEFGGIAPNKVSYSTEGIKVDVVNSASPLVHKLSAVQTVSGFEVELKFTGVMSEASNKGFEEDSYFRLGLVATGENRLGKLSALFAPAWVKQLFALAPPGLGLDKIYFYNLAVTASQVNSERQNPASDYIYERVIAIREKATQKISYRLKTPLETAALWISIDGDNTKSKFTTEIKSIKLELL